MYHGYLLGPGFRLQEARYSGLEAAAVGIGPDAPSYRSLQLSLSSGQSCLKGSPVSLTQFRTAYKAMNLEGPSTQYLRFLAQKGVRGIGSWSWKPQILGGCPFLWKISGRLTACQTLTNHVASCQNLWLRPWSRPRLKMPRSYCR